jgi:hypothetical protein
VGLGEPREAIEATRREEQVVVGQDRIAGHQLAKTTRGLTVVALLGQGDGEQVLGLPVPGRVVLAGACGAALTSFVMTMQVLLGIRWHVIGLLFVGRPFRGAGSSCEPGPAHRPPRSDERHAAAANPHIVGCALATWAGAASSPDLYFTG